MEGISLREIISFLVLIVGAVAWFIRIESNVKRNSERHDESKKRLDELEHELISHTQKTEIHHDDVRFSGFRENIDLRFAQVNEAMKNVRDDIKDIKQQFANSANRIETSIAGLLKKIDKDS